MAEDTRRRSPFLLITQHCGNLVSVTRLRAASAGVTRRRRSRTPRPRSWRLQDAKARFSELVRRAKTDGPQHVTVHGREEVVVVAADEFRRLSGNRSGQVLVEAMQASPARTVDLDAARPRMPVRDVHV